MSASRPAPSDAVPFAPAPAPRQLTPEQAVFLPIDFMSGLISACRSIAPAELRNNAIALAKVAALFRLPTIGTGDREGLTYLGAEMTEIERVLPDLHFIPRSAVSPWDAPGYAEAIARTGRRQLVMAGVTTEQCVALGAIRARAAGYDVYVVVDASASLDARAEQAAIARLAQAGVVTTTWSPLAAELLGDFATPEGRGLIEIYSQHQAQLRTLEDSYNTAVGRRGAAAGNGAHGDGADADAPDAGRTRAYASSASGA